MTGSNDEPAMGRWGGGRREPARTLGAAMLRRFATVGVINTLVDYVLFIALTKILRLPLDSVWIAKVISGTVAMANSFYWNRTWVFGSSGAAGVEQAARFLVTTATAVYVIQAFLTHVFSGRYPQLGQAFFQLLAEIGLAGVLPGVITEALAIKTVAFAVATSFSMSFNFLLYRQWVFRDVETVRVSDR